VDRPRTRDDGEGRHIGDSALLVNLAVALLAAMLGASLAVRVGQSTIVGYIVAGIAIGPFTPGFVGDPDLVGGLADIGVVFLMFAIGARVSLRELVQYRRVAIVGGSAQVAVTVAVGTVAGMAIGWGLLESLLLGAVVSNSSSAVLAKVLGERAETGTQHGHVALAWSTIQDLGTIVLIVLFSAAGGEDVGPEDVALAVVRAVVFLAVLMAVGAFLVPRLFELLASLRSREIFVLGVVSMALGIAYLGSFFGISLALGAFLAGVLVSESDLSHQVLGEALPFRDLFAGLFFVSIGMLVDPAFVLADPLPVLVGVALIVPLKGVIVAGLARLLGSRPRTAVLTGLALAQSAEFSFLLARLGDELGIVGPEAFSLMIAAAAVSIVLAPQLQRLGPALARAVERQPATMPGGLEVDLPPPGQRIAIVCGYGRVGRLVTQALERRGLRAVVVEVDGHLAEEAQRQGLAVLRGPAESPVVLRAAGLDRASVLVVAISDPIATRRIVDMARRESPRLPIVARTHSAAERAALARLGASQVVVGEVELGLEMARFTMRQMGVSSREVDLIVAGLRGR
jgi:monovalent cation:H+ antiporter-2, CPA2 family